MIDLDLNCYYYSKVNHEKQGYDKFEKSEIKYFISFDEFLKIEEDIKCKLFFTEITNNSNIYNPKWSCYKVMTKHYNTMFIFYYFRRTFVFTITINLNDISLTFEDMQLQGIESFNCSPKLVNQWPFLLNLYCLKKKEIIIYL